MPSIISELEEKLRSDLNNQELWAVYMDHCMEQDFLPGRLWKLEKDLKAISPKRNDLKRQLNAEIQKINQQVKNSFVKENLTLRKYNFEFVNGFLTSLYFHDYIEPKFFNYSQLLSYIFMYIKEGSEKDIITLFENQLFSNVTNLEVGFQEEGDFTNLEFFRNIYKIEKLRSFKAKGYVNYSHIVALTENQKALRIEKLDMSYCNLGDLSLRLMADAKSFDNLTVLNVKENLSNNIDMMRIRDLLGNYGVKTSPEDGYITNETVEYFKSKRPNCKIIIEELP